MSKKLKKMTASDLANKLRGHSIVVKKRKTRNNIHYSANHEGKTFHWLEDDWRGTLYYNQILSDILNRNLVGNIWVGDNTNLFCSVYLCLYPAKCVSGTMILRMAGKEINRIEIPQTSDKMIYGMAQDKQWGILWDYLSERDNMTT